MSAGAAVDAPAIATPELLTATRVPAIVTFDAYRSLVTVDVGFVGQLLQNEIGYWWPVPEKASWRVKLL